MDADLADGGHEVGVAGPARQDVHVEVFGDSGSGGASEIHADVEALRAVGLAQSRLAELGEVHHLVRHLFRRGVEVGQVRVRDDERVAADVRVEVEYDEVV